MKTMFCFDNLHTCELFSMFQTERENLLLRVGDFLIENRYRRKF
jgi:hypothetical protein